MLILWRPQPIRQKIYRILTRPTKQGEFLIFPYAYRQGGYGYIMGKTMKERLEAPLGDSSDYLFVVGFLLCLIAGILMTSLLMAIPAIAVVAGWRYYLHYRYSQRLTSLSNTTRIAPFRMTKQRYDMEFALQFSQAALTRTLVACYAIGAASMATLFASLGTQNGWALLAAGVGLASACTAAYFIHRLMQDRQRGISLGVEPGEIFDLPIPKPKKNASPQEQASA